MPYPTNQKRVFPALTGLRALTAYLVYAEHFNPFYQKNLLMYRLFNEMNFTLSIFFILSGFVITHRYIHQIPFSANVRKQYFIGRIARICPLYFGITLITFLYYLYKDKNISISSFFTLFTNLTFIKSFFNDLKFSLVAQGWTLTVEWCFYICAPVIIGLVKRSYKYIIIISAVLIIIGLLLVQVSQYFHPFYGFFDNNRFMFIYTFGGRGIDFLCGVGLAIFLHKQRDSLQKSIPRFTIIGLLLCFFLIFTFICLQSKEYWTGIFNPWGTTLNCTLLPISITIFLYGLIIEKTFLSQFLSSKIMILLGISSYAFYLLHLGIVSSFIKLYISKDNLIVHFIIMVLLSILVYKYIEKPLNEWIKRLNKRSLKYAY